MKLPETKPAALMLLAMLPKSDKAAEANQDSAHHNVECGRFAIADGVTRMLFSELFARSLTERFCGAGDAASRNLFETKDWQAWLLPSCQAWRAGVLPKIAAAQGLVGTTLKNRWNAGQLGGATFAGIEIKAGGVGDLLRWQAMVIGDCCLIHLDAKGRWLASHVLQSSDEFDSRPQMFVSGADGELPAPAFIQGTASRGDSFILASDAMAKWLMQQREAGSWALVEAWLRALDDAQAFADHIDLLRTGPPMVVEDDDMTLMRVKVAPNKPITPRILMPVMAQRHAVEVAREAEDAFVHPDDDDLIEAQPLRWAARLKSMAGKGWLTVRPRLTRRLVLPSIAVALVLVAVLLAYQSFKNDGDPDGPNATSTAVKTTVDAIMPVGAPISPLPMPTEKQPSPTNTLAVPRITPSPVPRPADTPTPDVV